MLAQLLLELGHCLQPLLVVRRVQFAIGLRQPAFDIYQLDGTAYPGNSGGPLLDPDTGLVLGLLNMTLVKTSRENLLSQPSGISYAIPVLHLRALMERR